MKGLQPKVHTVLYMVSAKASQAVGEKGYEAFCLVCKSAIANDDPYNQSNIFHTFNFSYEAQTLLQVTTDAMEAPAEFGVTAVLVRATGVIANV